MGALFQSYLEPWRLSLIALSLTIFFLLRRKERAVVVLVALLFGSMAISVRAQALASSEISMYLGSSISLTMKVSTDPTRTAPKVSGQNYLESSWTFLATAVALESSAGKYRLKVPIRVITSASEVGELLPGQRITAQATLVKSKEIRVAALALIRGEIEIASDPSLIAKGLGNIRLGLREISGEGNSGALIPGMVLGDTSKQSWDFKSDMRRSGLTHLTAVSGANFAIVSGFVLWCMQFIFRKYKYRIIATALSLIFFIGLVRPSPSVLRAAAMAAVVLFALSRKRSADSLPALGFAIAAVVIADPWQSRDFGFALSVLATGGLLLIAPKLIKFFSKFLPKLFAQALAPPIAAIIFCSPIIVALSGFLSPMSILANLLAAPAVAPITVFGFVAALIEPIFPALAQLLIFLVRPLAAFITSIASWTADFPVIELGVGIAGSLIVIAFLIGIWIFRVFFKRQRKIILILLICLLAANSWLTRFPGIDWQVGNCDVGQGDAMVINLGNHSGVVIDVGPDPALINKCLKQFGISKIAILVLTHFHADHVEGLPGLLNERSVGQVWVSPQIDPAFESARVQQWLGDIPQLAVTAGYSASIAGKSGPITLTAIWPRLGAQDSPNNSSIVLSLSSNDFSLLAAGDIEPIAQAQLLQRVSEVDLYKVAHHGSKYQNQNFMKALSPEISIISVGKDNSYGHPAPQTIQALSRIGSEVYRTDQDGALAINARRHRFKVRQSQRLFKFWQLG